MEGGVGAGERGGGLRAVVTRKRVTEVTRFSLAEEVGFEPTVPVDTAVFETARFGRSRTPPSPSLLPFCALLSGALWAWRCVLRS